jgi:hypothetical protein
MRTTASLAVAVAALVVFAAALASAAPPSCTTGVHQLFVDEAGASRYYECAAPNFVGYRDCPAGTVTGEVLGPLASDDATPCSKFARTVPGGVLPGMCNGQTGFVCKHDSEAHVAQFFWCAPPFFEGWQACPPGLYCESEGMHALPPCTTTVKPVIGTTSLTITLDSADPTFNRLACGGSLSGVGTAVYYETRTLQVSAAGSLTIDAVHTNDGYIILYSSFNPAQGVRGGECVRARDVRSDSEALAQQPGHQRDRLQR